MTSHSPILLIEDNPDDTKLAMLAFRTNKIENPVIVKDDGEAALRYVLDPEQPLPALILLDLQLPKIPGAEVLRAIRESERARLVPVVVLTSSSDEEDVRTCYRLGANSYVVKPVEFSRFADCIRQIVSYWLALNESPRLKDLSHAEAVARSHR